MLTPSAWLFALSLIDVKTQDVRKYTFSNTCTKYRHFRSSHLQYCLHTLLIYTQNGSQEFQKGYTNCMCSLVTRECGKACFKWVNLALKDACMCIACAEQVLELVSETITVEVRHQFHTEGQTGTTHIDTTKHKKNNTQMYNIFKSAPR